MTTSKGMWEKLRDKSYREHFVDAQVKRAIPFQIRSIMKARGLSQEQLASLAKLTQGVVSRAASPKYGNLTLNTIVRIAAGLDVAFIGRFVPFSELVRYYENLSEELGNVPTFMDEDAVRSRVSQIIAVEASSSAVQEGAARPQTTKNVEPFFRLTTPHMRRQPGRLVDFPPKRDNPRAATAALKAVSQ